jgi:hypothetical protein
MFFRLVFGGVNGREKFGPVAHRDHDFPLGEVVAYVGGIGGGFLGEKGASGEEREGEKDKTHGFVRVKKLSENPCRPESRIF